MANSKPPKKPGADRVEQAIKALRESNGALNGALDSLPPQEKLEELKSGLEAMNDSYPATRAFLNIRGLTSVSELDQKGREDLRRYLEQVLADVTKNKSN